MVLLATSEWIVNKKQTKNREDERRTAKTNEETRRQMLSASSLIS